MAEEILNNQEKITEAKEKLSGFERVVKETKEQVNSLIPSLTTFFGIFNGARIAQGIGQMVKFEQEFKNLSYQLGQSNTKTNTFLKNIYEVKAVTGDTAENLKAISSELIRNRVVGEDALKKLTTAVSFFSEATGMSSEGAAQLAGKLSRLGQLGPDSIEGILTSMMKVQRAFGMTSEEMTNLANGIEETTALLYNMGKNSAFIEEFQKGTVKLAAAFASVGIEAKNATDIVDRLLDLDRINENALLYSKLGISIQDAIEGNIDPGALQDKMKLLGKEIAQMSRPAGYALARQMGLKYGDVIKYQNMKPEEAEKQDINLKDAAEQQRTLFTSVEKFFSSRIGKLASMFLQSPMSFGSIFAVGIIFGITNAISKQVKRYRSIGREIGDATAEAIAQGLKKSGIVKDMQSNQGVIPDSKGGVFGAPKISNGGSSIAAYNQALNKIKTIDIEKTNAMSPIASRTKEVEARLTYLKENGQENSASFKSVEKIHKNLVKQLNKIEKRYEGFADTADKSLKKVEKGLTEADKYSMKKDAVTSFNSFWESWKTLKDQSKGLGKRLEDLQNQLKKTSNPMEREKIMATIGQLQEQKGGIDTQMMKAGSSAKSQLNRLREMGYTDSAYAFRKWTPTPGAVPIEGEQTKTLAQRVGGWAKNKAADAWDTTKGVAKGTGKAIGGYFKNLGSGLLGGLKHLLMPLGPMMVGMMVISKLMTRFQPLMEMMAPLIDGIFDVLAKAMAPLLKWAFSAIYFVIGHIMNGIFRLINIFLPKGKEISLFDVAGQIKQINEWQVGQKMDKEAKEREEEKAVTFNALDNGVQALDFSDEKVAKQFGKYWGGREGFDKLAIQLNKLVELSEKNLNELMTGNTERKKIAQTQTEKDALYGPYSPDTVWTSF